MENESLWAFETLRNALYLNMADHPKHSITLNMYHPWQNVHYLL